MAIALKKAKSNKDINEILNERSTLIKDLNIKFEELNIADSITLQKLRKLEYCLALIMTVEKLLQQGYNKVTHSLLKDILISRGENQGKFFEVMAYYYFLKKGICFKPQLHIESDFCYKMGKNGYYADGEILEFSCIFDIKGFGIGFPHIRDFEMKLQKEVNCLFQEKIELFFDESNKIITELEQQKENEICTDLENQETIINNEKRKNERMKNEVKNKKWNYTITVNGSYNMAMEKLTEYIKSVADIAKDLVDRAWKERMSKWEDISTWNNNNPIVMYGLGFFQKQLKDLGLTCTLESGISTTMRGMCHTGIYEFSPYKWAMNNKFYFLGDASQFVKNQPYLIICVLDKSDNIFLQDTNQYNVYFRPLCRRIFVELNRITDQDIQTVFDGKAKPTYPVSEAVKKITGIIFLEITGLVDVKNGKSPMWIYLNPNADNPLLKYQIDQLHILMPEIIEDYKYDNY